MINVGHFFFYPPPQARSNIVPHCPQKKKKQSDAFVRTTASVFCLSVDEPCRDFGGLRNVAKVLPVGTAFSEVEERP
jgi:hypothetical protein